VQKYNSPLRRITCLSATSRWWETRHRPVFVTSAPNWVLVAVIAEHRQKCCVKCPFKATVICHLDQIFWLGRARFTGCVCLQMVRGSIILQSGLLWLKYSLNSFQSLFHRSTCETCRMFLCSPTQQRLYHPTWKHLSFPWSDRVHWAGEYVEYVLRPVLSDWSSGFGAWDSPAAINPNFKTPERSFVLRLFFFFFCLFVGRSPRQRSFRYLVVC